MSKSKPDLIVVGALLGAHGVRGDVRVKSFTGEPDALFDYGPFSNEQGEVILDPKSARPAKDHFIVTPLKPLQKEEWDALKGTRLYIPRERLPETDDDDFYIEDLVGLTVQDSTEAVLGRVKAVQNHGAGDLLEIQPKSGGKSVLIPFTLADVPTIDLAQKSITVMDFETWADESKPKDDLV